MLNKIFNWWKSLSEKQKGLCILFLLLALPIIFVAGLFLFILIPFIVMLVAFILLVLALFKRDKRRQFGISSLIAFIISVSTFSMVDMFMQSDMMNTEEETVNVDQLEESEKETLAVGSIHENETINHLLSELNAKYGIGLTEESFTEKVQDIKVSFQLNGVDISVSDTDKNLFIELNQTVKKDNDGALLEGFRQLMSALSLPISNTDFNKLVSELKTYQYQDYNKYTINDSDFTLNRQELENDEVKLTIKGQLSKADLFKASDVDYKLELGKVETDKKEESNEEIKNETTEQSIQEAGDNSSPVTQQVSGDTKVHFIDTGHSDSVLIENNGKFALIDAGDRDDDTTVKSYLTGQGVKRLEYLIITHFHADHFGAADTVVTDFEVGTTFVSNGNADTQVYQDFINSLSNKGLKPSVPLEGGEVSLGNATLTFYNTRGGNSNENNNSLVTLLQSGSRQALFTGDAESQVEANLTNIGDVDLFKAGHHGSDTSNTSSLLNRIKPEHVVIMAGANNKYGHPSAEVMNRFKSLGIPVYRTDEQGTIIVTLSEDGVSVDKEPGSYKSGDGTQSSSSTSSNSSNSTSSEASSNSSNSTSSESSSQESTTTQNKDDNPNGVHNQQSTAPQQSYQNCTLLRQDYPDGVPQGHPAYASKHDRDKDGWACER
ncbi:MBL fold metallo-hydrolase [Turicibacter bilis]|uniref:MBL fold metallo-hydrolase n=1 Tax=Turicibacter bilis TaxID=2735723 RepID=A0ABY5JHD2_9FIRM|nr:MBL fold metallo-hydrolase [Turicibacter bilis]MBS3199530.1 MBL fold metallo-hydrolase [Turicibacter bilis]UUF06104.1 MBL fold metallo-hydrolase [Turicibacter bilis]